MLSIKIEHLVYYFSTIDNYRKAMSEISTKSSSTPTRVMHLADSIINTRTNDILKCRYTITEIFDSYYGNISEIRVTE